jgi:uncharacterized membrane protein
MGYWLPSVLMFLILCGGAVVGVVLLVYLSNLSREVKTLARRVGAIEAGLTQAPQAEAPQAAQPGQPPPIPAQEPQGQAHARPKPPPPPPRMARPLDIKKPDWNIETLIGGRVLNRVGVILAIFTVGLFLQHAFVNDWIGETGRVAIGLLIGLVFLGIGEWYRRKDYPYFSPGLTGGGIAILYLSIYAAYGFYHLIPMEAAFLFMIGITGAGVFLAVWNRALAIAALSTLGGFLTPFILSTGVDNQVGLFSYILLLNAGILATAYFRNWPLLNYQSFILTIITFSVWAARFYKPEKLGPTALFLTLFFVLFALLSIMYNIVNRRKASPPELVLAFLNAGIYFGAMYFLLDKEYGSYLGLFALAMGAAYVALAYLTDLRHGEDRFLIWILLGIAATFVTLAVPIQLKQNWITVGWAVEGAILAYIAYRYDSANTRLAAYAILALVLFRLIFLDASLPSQFVREEFALLFNRRVFSFVVGIAAMGLAAYLYSRGDKPIPVDKTFMAVSLLITANLLAIILLSVEAYDYFRHLRAEGVIQQNIYRYAQQLSLSIIWALYATALIVAGIWKKNKPLRYMALALFTITICKVFLIDLSTVKGIYRIASFAVLTAIVLAVSLLYQKYRDVLQGPQVEGDEAQ